MRFAQELPLLANKSKELLPSVVRNTNCGPILPFFSAMIDGVIRMQRSIFVSRGFRVLQRATALFLVTLMVPAGWAQDASSAPAAPSAQKQSAMPSASQPFNVKEYAKPRSHFPDPLAPYTPRHVELPNLANTPRIDELMHDGKLYISMNDAIALALENNLDIAIARYNLNIADTDVWRAKAGSATLGVPFGVVQNTPGGGVGGLGTQVGSGQGGTSVAAGGAGVGVGGLVGSTFGLGTAITQLRSHHYGYPTARPQHSSLIQYFRADISRQHHHRKLLLPTGIYHRHQYVGRV
jgi:hypothetical protein